MLNFEMTIQQIKGIGPKTSLLFNRINIFTIEDLLKHFPRDYEDRTIQKPIPSLIDGEIGSVSGEVYLVDRGRYTRTGTYLNRVVLKNDTGYVTGVWFNQRYINGNFKIGDKYLFYGKVSVMNNEKQIMNPEYEKINEKNLNAIVPVYPSTKKLSQKIIRNALNSLINSTELRIDDILPKCILKKYGLCDIFFALRNIHFPESEGIIESAQKRIKFEELLVLQLGLILERSKIQNNEGIKFSVSGIIKEFTAKLPFELTTAQKKCIDQLLDDMSSNRQMNRLVQGDVGSGKTIVAAIGLLNAVKNGYQGVLMAPTEILATQHYESLTSLYDRWGINVELLSGKISNTRKSEIKEKLRLGEIDILIGTHAVIQEDVEFNKLGMVVTDEQHRFGVRQRAILNQKGFKPDVLVMTATPIPRTMALFIYGDLDISIIDEMPPGRLKIDTYPVRPPMKQRIYDFVKKEVQKGRQAYVICPLIDKSDILDAESAIEMAEKLKKEYLKDIRVGLLHGRMKSNEKDDIMVKFKNREIDILVSTTVIEVGINIPNASVIVIENADRFGLAQLHQLRGRVGRGMNKSYCILISEMKSELSRKRMKIMRDLDDGFKMAEKDMEIRGTGEFFGTRQHGLPELKLADIFIDSDILKLTNMLAKELVISGEINNDEFRKLRLEVDKKFFQKSEIITFN